MARDLERLSPATRWLGREIEIRDEVDSTNTVAEELASAGAADGTLVVADRQTAGRGRLGRSFFSPGGRSLYMSLILRPEMHAEHVHRHVFAAAVAVARRAEVHVEGRAEVRIKWPNDVWLDGRKTSGINLPVQLDGARVRWAVLGIGLNVNTRPDEFPAELREIATSLAEARGSELDRVEVAAGLLSELEGWIDRIRAGRFDQVLDAWRTFSALDGARVRIGGPGIPVPYEGRVAGVDSDGALLLDGAGGRHRVLAGDVTVLSKSP